ncbi:uncharacterized protein LOC125501879, partial [Athalia rosae]|uniref:uncharacterized protein LOC125501879 n=1 Tax=Athalia rosae TaxID=37344 RepID=UPI0020341C2B
RKPIIANVDTVTAIVKASDCLHNFLEQNNGNNPYCPHDLVDFEDRYEGSMEALGSWHVATHGAASQPIRNAGNDNNTQRAANIRIEFTVYFNNKGAVK